MRHSITLGGYRGVFIRKDIMITLSKHGEMNRTELMSYFGLNANKHNEILDDMVAKGFIMCFEYEWKTRKVHKYKLSGKGSQILREIMEPYELLFLGGKHTANTFA